jgi:translation initiation factor 4G
MPSNEKLTEDILALDPEAKVEGLTNPKLVALLKQLRAKAYVASKQPEIEKSAEVGAKLIDVLTQGKGLQLVAPPEEDAPEPKVEEPKVEEPKVEEPKVEEPKVEEPKVEEPKPAAAEPTNVHRVAEGKSITSKRGVLGPGDEVRPEYFVGGESVLDDLIEKGLVK